MFISYSIAHSVAPIKVPPGADRPPLARRWTDLDYQIGIFHAAGLQQRETSIFRS